MSAAGCPACGRGFDCRAREGGCWCNAESVPASLLAELAVRFDGCLCPACLRALARGRELTEQARGEQG